MLAFEPVLGRIQPPCRRRRRRRQLDARLRARRASRSASRSRTSRPACAASTAHAGGDQPPADRPSRRYLFTTEPRRRREPRARGHRRRRRVVFVGNTMIDTLLRFRERGASAAPLPGFGLDGRRVRASLTLHRPTNVDEPGAARAASSTPSRADQPQRPGRLPGPPAHARSGSRRPRLDRRSLREPGVIICEPLGYLDFVGLVARRARSS